MASQPTRVCPKCGLPSQEDQRFCANCGSSIDVGSNKPTELTPFSVYDASLPDMETHAAIPPPPPPADAYSQPSLPISSYPPPAPGYSTPAPGYSTPAPGYLTPAPGYSTPAPGYLTPAPGYQPAMSGYQLPEELLSPQRPAGVPLKDSSKGVLGQIGCAMLGLILLGLLLCGGLSYLIYYLITVHS